MRPLARLRMAADLVAVLRTAIDASAVLMFTAVFLIFCFKIALRYFAHESMAWADEVCVILFVWIVFWANALMLRERDHIRFDLVVLLLPPQGRRLFALLRSALLAAVFLYALPPTLGYVLFLWRERTSVLQWRLDHVYLCFVLFVAAVVVRCAVEVIRLLGPRWRTLVS